MKRHEQPQINPLKNISIERDRAAEERVRAGDFVQSAL
jgi:hypothetical protein